ncbi:hypothetical protein CG724_17580 [Streptomyces sp. CB02120-2]|nr:hypothetical protein CG724_17580 [Streptomyces sp. CB02120-2]
MRKIVEDVWRFGVQVDGDRPPVGPEADEGLEVGHRCQLLTQPRIGEAQQFREGAPGEPSVLQGWIVSAERDRARSVEVGGAGCCAGPVAGPLLEVAAAVEESGAALGRFLRITWLTR